MSNWREEVAEVLEVVARDGFPEPRDLDVALDAIASAVSDEIEKLRAALTNAAAVIGSLYAFAETADAVSISGVARCNTMLTSMKKNRARIEETIMKPARAALGEKE